MMYKEVNKSKMFMGTGRLYGVVSWSIFLNYETSVMIEYSDDSCMLIKIEVMDIFLWIWMNEWILTNIRVETRK